MLILADGYPQQVTEIPARVFAAAEAKSIRLFVEYPGALPGLTVGTPKPMRFARVVIASDFFGEKLKKLRILAVHGLQLAPVNVERSHMVAARVAGFDHAVYGLPAETAPILFQIPNRNVLVATTKLSHFVTGRYAPQDAWREIWRSILAWATPAGSEPPPLRWTPAVRAAYDRQAPLAPGHQREAIRRGRQWFDGSKMLVRSSGGEDAASPDGSLGSMEAVLSHIRHDGSQTISSALRGDCITETAMAHAFSSRLLQQDADARIAKNLVDFYLFESPARKKERGDPNHSAYGLIAWGVSSEALLVANYGDDNARLMLAVLATAALTGDDRWDEAMMMCLLGNLRTAGRYGFRGGRIDVPQLNQRPWQSYFAGKIINRAPHYECYLWACYLWAYEQTGWPLFLNRAETGLRMMMDEYPDGWRWTNGLAQEKARMLLPLAWLVRVKDTSANRAMLRKVIDGVLALQQPCGAIREELGDRKMGRYPPPRDNASYGTAEAPLIAENGDPVSDLLYTTNFAFLGLREAAAATGDPDIVEAENRLAKFLCRIQIDSPTLPQVDGGWFRAFDFNRWEHWGSNADAGWGAWSIESGWTQGWIVAVLAMREMETSLWDLTKESRIERHFPRLRAQMIPDDAVDLVRLPSATATPQGKP